MKYVSTRSLSEKVSSAFAIVEGIAPDGGLYTPLEIPVFKVDDFGGLLNYCDLGANILSKFLTDFSFNELSEICNKAYSAEKFSSPHIVPLKKLDDNISVAELWHGPTSAFKDMALQMLPHLITKSMDKLCLDKNLYILVATSGDTGKAALEGFKNVDKTKVFVYYPADGVSQIQKLQMQTQEGNNVCVHGINGNFDDAQTAVKSIFANTAVNDKLHGMGISLSSANSINWGRLAPQVIYYFSSYLKMVSDGSIKMGDEVNFCVPTGNFGNILAGYIAKCAGLPIGRLICASNKNNVLFDFFRTGIYDKNRVFYQTSSPSMDILISSNLERLLFYVSNNDVELVSNLMNSLRDKGRYAVSSDILKRLDSVFYAGYTEDISTTSFIRDTYDKYGYLIDTHTAVAMKVCKDYIRETGDSRKTVVLSTANPYKFAHSVLEAFGKFDFKNDFEYLYELNKITGFNIPENLLNLRDKKIIFDTISDKSDIVKTIGL